MWRPWSTKTVKTPIKWPHLGKQTPQGIDLEAWWVFRRLNFFATSFWKMRNENENGFFFLHKVASLIRYFSHTAWKHLELQSKTHFATLYKNGNTTCETFSVSGLILYQTRYLVCHINQPIVLKLMYCNGCLCMSGQGI